MNKNKNIFLYDNGYSLIEMAMVLTIIAVLFSLGFGIWKGIYHYIKLQQMESQFRDLTEEIEISSENVDKILTYVKSRVHLNYLLIFSDYFLKEFPYPCYYDRELSPAVDDYPLTAGKKQLAFAFITPGSDNNYQFGYNGDFKLIIPDFRKKVDLFPFDGKSSHNFDDQTFLPTYERLRLQLKCKRPPPAAIDYIKPEKRITVEPLVKYEVVYPGKYDLLVQAHGFVKTFRTVVRNITVPLEYGINRIGFSLVQSGETVYTRYDYVVRINENSTLSLPLNIVSNTHTAPTIVSFTFDIQNPKTSVCLIDFDDGFYKYFPVCNFTLIKHLYSARGKYQPAIFVEQGTNFYYNSTHIYFTGNSAPIIDVDLDVDEVPAKRNKKKLEYKIDLHARVTDDDAPLFCRLYYDSKLIMKTKNCKNLTFTGYSKNATLNTFKIAVDDKNGARTIKTFFVTSKRSVKW